MFQYYMPTKVYWGKGCLLNTTEDLTRLGKRAFIVTGRSSANLSGALPDLRQVLEKQKIKHYLFTEVSENPELESVHLGAELFQRSKCDFLIGLGGGSPIDAAKAISVTAANNLKERDIYQPEKLKKAFPLLAIPTTSGTGTEVTPYSVISDKELQKKAGFGNPLIFPKISYCDPEYTFSLPEKVTIDTAIDALSHLLEGIYSRKRCELLFPLIVQGVKDIVSSLKQVTEEPVDYELREKLMRGSLYGGMVIAQSGTTLQHSIGYPLTTHYGLSHGMANGIVMKTVMELFTPAVKDDLDRLFDGIGLSRKKFYQWLDNWMTRQKLSLPEEFIEQAAEEIVNSRNMTQNPRQVSREEIREILKGL